ncbi:hypothetical protein IQ22_04753 [Pseudomonas duriflava]|uniref:Uncharacterized protein n=1 Tax=Pseudomonas duriflava TaxID=459528 RepID=A0A562PHM6_9PSED|nr:hypothetical protein IQ22_04753 [Pseudomonas duriflava]
MRLLLAYTLTALLSGGIAFLAAALLGVVAIFALPFVANFPAPDPPDSIDFGKGMLMMMVGFSVFAALLVPLWVVSFRYVWKKFDVDSFIANGAVRN